MFSKAAQNHCHDQKLSYIIQQYNIQYNNTHETYNGKIDTLLYPGETGIGTVMSCFEKLKWCFKMDIGKKLIAKYQKNKISSSQTKMVNWKNSKFRINKQFSYTGTRS